jgi:hypothetical protein
VIRRVPGPGGAQVVHENMLKYLFLALSLTFLVIGFGSMFFGHSSFSSMLEGVGKGCAGVFFILFYIFMLLGRQPRDKTSGH